MLKVTDKRAAGCKHHVGGFYLDSSKSDLYLCVEHWGRFGFAHLYDLSSKQVDPPWFDLKWETLEDLDTDNLNDVEVDVELIIT